MSSDISSSVGAYEAKTHFAEILQRVERGEAVTITRHGTPVARLVPMAASSTASDRKQAINRILERRKSQRLRGLSIREMINEGRP